MSPNVTVQLFGHRFSKELPLPRPKISSHDPNSLGSLKRKKQNHPPHPAEIAPISIEEVILGCGLPHFVGEGRRIGNQTAGGLGTVSSALSRLRLRSITKSTSRGGFAGKWWIRMSGIPQNFWRKFAFKHPYCHNNSSPVIRSQSRCLNRVYIPPLRRLLLSNMCCELNVNHRLKV